MKITSRTHYSNRTRYFGYPSTDVAADNTKDLHFPGLHPKAARWLVTRRAPLGVGIDTPSIDYGQSVDFLTHQVLGEYNVWGLENLNNLGGLPSKGFTVHNMVYKLKDGSGGPSRVLASIPAAAIGGAAAATAAGSMMSFANLMFLALAAIHFAKGCSW